MSDAAHDHAMEIIGEYGELFLFLLVAITYVNTMEERRAFEVLRADLVGRGLELPAVVPADRGAGVLSVLGAGQPDDGAGDGGGGAGAGPRQPALRGAGLHLVVVAANAGGAFSPFGDITTLMVWQKGKLGFFEFFALFMPSVINWLVPAAIMFFAMPVANPSRTTTAWWPSRACGGWLRCLR